MEPISLAVGAVALASLFSLCIQCFDLIEVGKSSDADFELLIIRLSIEKRRLMIWGEAVGILRPDTNRDALLDDPQTQHLVKQILENVQRLFQESDALKAKYGDDKSSAKSPILAQDQSRMGLRAKTKWAIRDSRKLADLVQKLRDLLDGLNAISTSTSTTARKGQLVRQEMESIPDLRTLKIIERTCSDRDWRSAASAASEYFEHANTLEPSDREDIEKWAEKVDDRAPAREPRVHENDRSTAAAGRDEHARADAIPRLSQPNCPHERGITEILVLSSSQALVAWTSGSGKYFDPLAHMPEVTIANHQTATRMLRAIRRHPAASESTLVIYCPPRMQWVHLALTFLGLAPAVSSRLQIRIDDRLLDLSATPFSVRDRMQGYLDELEAAAQQLFTRYDPGINRLLNAIDMHWLAQRTEVLTTPSVYGAPGAPFDWHAVFRQSRDDYPCVGALVLAGENVAWDLLNLEPVWPPDTFRDGRVYRLRELDRATDKSKYRWKAEHYCNVALDQEFESQYPVGP